MMGVFSFRDAKYFEGGLDTSSFTKACWESPKYLGLLKVLQKGDIIFFLGFFLFGCTLN